MCKPTSTKQSAVCERALTLQLKNAFSGYESSVVDYFVLVKRLFLLPLLYTFIAFINYLKSNSVSLRPLNLQVMGPVRFTSGNK